MNGNTPVPLGQDGDGRAIWDWEPRPTHGEFPWFYQRRGESNEDYCRRTGRAESPMQRLAREAVESENGTGPAKEGRSSAGGLATFTLGTLWDSPEPEVEWLADKLLPQDGVSLIVSQPKVGKSTLVRCLAKVVAAGGGEWLGRTTGGGTVLHLALEERRQTVAKHYESLAAPRAGLHVVFGPAPPPDERWDLLRETMRILKPTLLVVDTLGRWMTGVDDGNAYAQALPAMDPFLELARASRCHVALLHHARKSGGEFGEESLGSTGVAGSADTILSIRRKGGRRTITALGRDDVDMEETVLVMDEDGWVHTGTTEREADLQDMTARVYEWLKFHGGEAGKAEIRKGLGAGGTPVARALQRLVEDRQVTTSGKGVRGDPFLYSVLTP